MKYIDLRDYRKLALGPGDAILDYRGDVWRVLDTPKSFQNEGFAKVEPYYRPGNGVWAYRPTYHTFLLSERMARAFAGGKNKAERVRLYNHLTESIHAENRETLASRKRRLDRILKSRGIRREMKS